MRKNLKRIIWILGYILLLIILLICSYRIANAAGTVTVATTRAGHNMYCVTYTWTADASAASVPSTASDRAFDGYVIAVVTNPGSTAPTDDYDITLTNSDGADVLGGAGADRDTANTEIALPLPDGVTQADSFFSGVLTLNLSNNSVNSATGTVQVYIRVP